MEGVNDIRMLQPKDNVSGIKIIFNEFILKNQLFGIYAFTKIIQIVFQRMLR
jgi:hypothetical protein